MGKTNESSILASTVCKYINAWACRIGTDQQDRLMYTLELQTTLRMEKITLRGLSAVPEPSPRKLRPCRSSIWSLLAPPHTSAVEKGTHNGATNLPEKKILNRCIIVKFCLTTAPSIGLKKTERNRTNLHARIKYSMLMFTSISDNKNNSFYNSDGQKNLALEQK